MSRRVHHDPASAATRPVPDGMAPLRGLTARGEAVIAWLFMPVVIGACLGGAWLCTLWGVA